ncbi:MAG: response regulator transcription factor, partial [Bdellovibrionota bacterium]
MKHQTILVVEDDEGIRDLMLEILVQEGYTAAGCENGQQALEFLDAHPSPCLILLDMMMPILNGKEFMDAFRKRPHTIVPIPIYLVSATSDGVAGADMGCAGFLRKP